MNLPSQALSSILALSFSATALFAGVPDPEPVENPPVQQQAVVDLKPKTEAAVQSILDLFRWADGGIYFDRTGGIPIDYTLVFVIAAPNGIGADAARQPFEIRRANRIPHARVTIALTGYYDTKAQSLQLYDTVTKTYVVPAEHLKIKALTALIDRRNPPAPKQPAPPDKQN